ncbi:hypothetical protein NX059_001063 [Plenodomus lindquistii]|nr:hypothetical protein NX059_001063 [Plenodomus lindquistii]
MCSTRYTHISEAGFGLRSSVHYCLRKATITSAQRQAAVSKDRTIDYGHLTDKLIVAKVNHIPAPNKGMKNEIELLKAIRDQSASHYAQDRFFQLLNWDTSRIMPQWFTTSTFPIGCSLEQLQYHYDVMPEEFTWLVFTQLLEALDFIHNVCDPPIAHGDLFPCNIMIGYLEHDDNILSSLPQLKLIDFENSRFCKRERNLGPLNDTLSHPDNHGFASDILLSIRVLHVIAGLHLSIADCGDPAIYDPVKFPDIRADYAKLHLLYATLSTSQKLAHDNTPWVLQSLYNHFSPHAYRKLATISESAENQMRDIIFKAARPKYEEMQRKLVEVVDTLE